MQDLPSPSHASHHGEDTTPGSIPSACNRSGELAELARLLSQHRVVVIVGGYGVGKTWLANRFFANASARDADRVLFCDLTSAFSERDVEHCIGRLLDGLDAPPRPGEGVGRRLASLGPCLLILDNLEQLGSAGGAAIANLIASSPDLHVLATSRERLHLIDEVCLELQPLQPAAAVALLAERARSLAPDFVSGSHNAAAMARIVDQIDRLPLAIEMTAPWLQVLSADELSARLANGLELEHGGRPPTRHHASIDAAIAWSWDLLSPVERLFLLQLSVFAGSFDVDDAQAVASLPPGSPPALALLRRLRERSMLRSHRRDQHARVEFSLASGVRRFARERAPWECDFAGVAARHRAHVVARVCAHIESGGEGVVADSDFEIMRLRVELAALCDKSEGADLDLKALLSQLAGESTRVESTAPAPSLPTSGDCDVIEIGPRLDWMRLGTADVIPLGRRGAVRQLLGALAQALQDRPGEPLTLEMLFAAGWPGDQIATESVANRVYAALSTLRRFGLEPYLVTRREGWLLDPQRLRVVRHDP